MSVHGRTETQVKQYVRQFHSVHLADIMKVRLRKADEQKHGELQFKSGRCDLEWGLFGRPYYRSSLWYTVSSVCRLSVVVCLSSVTFCIVAKRYVLAKNCLKEWIGNQGQKVDFLGRRHISTSGFAATATETAVFALFFARIAQQSVPDGTNGLSSSKPCVYCRIVRSELKPDSGLFVCIT